MSLSQKWKSRTGESGRLVLWLVSCLFLQLPLLRYSFFKRKTMICTPMIWVKLVVHVSVYHEKILIILNTANYICNAFFKSLQMHNCFAKKLIAIHIYISNILLNDLQSDWRMYDKRRSTRLCWVFLQLAELLWFDFKGPDQTVDSLIVSTP